MRLCTDVLRLDDSVCELIPNLDSREQLGRRLLLGLEDGLEVAAVAAIHRITDFDAMVCLGSRSPKWGYGLRSLGRMIGNVAFENLGLKRLTAKCAETNWPARQMLLASGFRLEGKMPLAWDGETTALIYGCMKQNWRWC